jgi:flagellar hook protein FlgE
MGMFGALNSAVSGLRAQAFAMENISGNIANSQTIGFKRIDTTFADLVTGAGSSSKNQTSGMVLATSRSTNTVQGDIQASDNATYMAINGDGYFVVSSKISESDGNPVFSGFDLYTRRGDFETDKNGYLVNGSGYYLKGLIVDPTTGNAAGSVPQVIHLSSDFLQAEATDEVEYRANLPATPFTANYDPSIANSELLDATGWATDPLVGGDETVLGSDAQAFLDSSISGYAATMYNANGAPVSVQFRWAKVDSVANGGADTWNLFYQVDSDAGPTDVAWQNVGTDYIFDSAGQLSPPITSLTISGLTSNGVTVGDVTIDHGTGGITQYEDANGSASLTTLSQNGSPSGQLVGVQISDGGKVVANYSNGKSVTLALIPLATFNADGGLMRLDGGAYAATEESGNAIFGSGAGIVGQSLEASNTDIADEFSKLIVTQQAYSANTRIISTADDMLKEILNIIR